MSHPSLANSQNVPAGPFAASAPSKVSRPRFTIVDVHHASPEELRVIRGIGVPVPENIGWAHSPFLSASSSPPANDCSSPSSASSDGSVEPASGPSRRSKKSKDARRKAAGPRPRSKTSSTVARPSNCFILFRQEFTSSDEGKKYLQTVEGKQNNISRIVGAIWRNMNDDEKKPYRLMQEELARQHKLENPEYQFAPSRRGPTKKRVNKNKDTDVAISEYVAGLHQTLPTDAIVEASERFKVELKAKRASASPTGSPAREISPASTPKAFVDPLYPPGDRTPQPRPAEPRVIELTPAPTPVPSSSSTSAPSGPSSASHYPMQPLQFPSQRHSYGASPTAVAPVFSPWPAPATPAPHPAMPAQPSFPAAYQQGVAPAYQQYGLEQVPFDMSLSMYLTPVDAYPLEHTMPASPMHQQQLLPDFDPALFERMSTPMPFDQPLPLDMQDIVLDAHSTIQPQFYQDPFAPQQQQYSTTAPEQPWASTSNISYSGDCVLPDVDAMSQDLTSQQRQFFEWNGQFLQDYSQGANAQWNA